MTRAIVSIAAVLAVAGSASAFVAQNVSTSAAKDPSFNPIPEGAIRGVTGATIPLTFVVDVESWDANGSPNNVVLIVDLNAALGRPSGLPMSMTSVGWDVTLSALGTSWLSENRVYFDDAVAPDLSGLFLRPGAGTNVPGGPQFFSSGGLVDLSDAGIPNIFLPDGFLRMEFDESFDDAANVIDGIWHAGSVLTIGVDVPTPGALALCGVAGLAGIRRRR